MIIYILKLENNKYYVGRTYNYDRRISDHFSGKGSYWTKINKPIEVIKRIDNVNSNFEEDKILKETMMKYGIENVRGGSYVREFITCHEKHLLEKEIRFAQDLCILCGSNTHFVKNCDQVVVYACEICDLEFENQIDCEYHVNNCDQVVVYACEICDLEFKNKIECLYHVNNCIVAEEKNCCCIIC